MAQLSVGVSHSRRQQAEQHMRPSKQLARLPTVGAAQRQQRSAHEFSTRRPGHHLRHRVQCIGQYRHDM